MCSGKNLICQPNQPVLHWKNRCIERLQHDQNDQAASTLPLPACADGEYRKVLRALSSTDQSASGYLLSIVSIICSTISRSQSDNSSKPRLICLTDWADLSSFGRASYKEPAQSKDTFEVDEEHLDLLATPLSGWIELGSRAFSCEVSDDLIFLADNAASGCVWAALGR